MSTIREVARIKKAKADIRAALMGKGAEVHDYEKIDAYPGKIMALSTYEKTIQELAAYTPGGDELLGGDWTCGYLGAVTSEELGLLESGEVATATSFAAACGVTAGSPINEEITWRKFISEGELVFIPDRVIRYNFSWSDLFKVGVTSGRKAIKLGAVSYDVRLLSVRPEAFWKSTSPSAGSLSVRSELYKLYKGITVDSWFESTDIDAWYLNDENNGKNVRRIKCSNLYEFSSSSASSLYSVSGVVSYANGKAYLALYGISPMMPSAPDKLEDGWLPVLSIKPTA